MKRRNKWEGSGVVNSRPVLRRTGRGRPVCNFYLLMDESHDKADGTHVPLEMVVDITLWGDLAEAFVERHKKGDEIVIEGKLARDDWVADDGSPRTKLKVVARDFYQEPENDERKAS